MRNFKRSLSFVAIFALLFTSCSKEDENVLADPNAKTTLSFGAVLNDLMHKKGAFKQAVGDIPSCSADAPAYVDVVLTTPQGGSVVGTVTEPLRVDVNPNAGDYDGDGVEEYFTDESASLELEAGTYSLQYFTVLNAAGDVIWAAPIAGKSMATFVDQSLPFNIDLNAGVKKYVDVDVLCFEDRLANEYGYLFFDIETTEAFEFCFFANYCAPDGRHYPAAYTVDISVDGNVLYSGVSNKVGIGNEDDPFNDEDPYADPLCLTLPNLAQYANDDEYIDYTITLMDWDGVYGDVEQVQITGSLSKNEIMAKFDGDDNVDYEHIRFGCGDDDEEPAPAPGGDEDEDGIPDETDNCPSTVNPDQLDSDQDGIGDVCDECPNEAGTAELDGCPEEGQPEPGPEPEECDIEAADADCGEAFLEGENEEWVQISDPDDDFAGYYSLLSAGTEENPFATVTISLVNGDPVFQINTTEEYEVDDYVIWVSQQGNNEIACISAENIAAGTGDEPDAEARFTADLTYPFYAMIKANVCD